MNKRSCFVVITILYLACTICQGENASLAADIHSHQSTTGHQSPAINAGRDVTVIYSSEVESKIIEKLSEIAKQCEEPAVKLEDLQPNLDSLALYKIKALPFILNFAAGYINLLIDKYDPFLLQNYRTQLQNKQLFGALFYTIQKIYRSDPQETLNYFHDLYINKYPLGLYEREALITAYYLRLFPQQDIGIIFAKFLQGSQISEWDPVRKALLRTFLQTNFTDKYFLKSLPKNKVQAVQPHKSDWAEQMRYTASLATLGIEDMQNADIFLEHLFNYLYESLQRKTNKNGATSTALIFREIKETLGTPRGVYLFGFDFYDSNIFNLRLDNVLLGKTFFENAHLIDIEFSKCSILECDFKNAIIYSGLFEKTDFIGSNLEGLKIRWGGNLRTPVFSHCDFKGANMNKTQFFDTVIINTNFENCRFTNSKLQINAGLLLNVRFLATDLKRIVFDEVLIDEQTLRNISTLPGFNKSDYKIEDVTMEKLDLTASDPIFAITEKDMYGTPEYQLNSVLHYLRNTNKKYYDQTMAIMVQHKMFRISSIKVENLDGSIH